MVRSLKGKDLNRFYIIRTVGNLMLRCLKPSHIKIGKNKLLLDSDDSLRLSILGVYEPFMTKVFKEKVHSGDMVLDIGAHIGYYTLLAAKRVGRHGSVYAFEPEPTNFTLLSRNIHDNHYKNVKLVNKAVTSYTKKIKLFLCPTNAGNHSTVYNFQSKKIIVKGVSLDDFFGKTIPKISVIKMDIEGGEYSAIEGMKKILKANKNLILFTELWPIGLRSAKRSPSEYIKLLERFGFHLYVIDEEQKKLEPLNIRNSHNTILKYPNWHVNLLALRERY